MTEDRSENDSEEKSWLDKITHLFSTEPRTRQDLQDVLSVAADNEVIDTDARSIIEGALQVSDMQTREIMIPRSQMVVVKHEWSLEEILPNIISTGHSRYPVIGENPDDVLGVLLVKDLLPQILNDNREEFQIDKLLRPTLIVPESKRLNVLLREFRENRNHMAIVIDEYGGIAGLVTIEDVLEEIVGEIEDETDAQADRGIRKVSDGDYVLNALTPIDEFNDYFESQFNTEEFDTIGGLVIQAFGHMPTTNEITVIENFEFKVITADQRKVQTLRLRPADQ
ncbi:MAG: magnesium and cobalt transporter [Halioglobus sp.]|jgi:magnesium and cobalt transporter